VIFVETKHQKIKGNAQGKVAEHAKKSKRELKRKQSTKENELCSTQCKREYFEERGVSLPITV